MHWRVTTTQKYKIEKLRNDIKQLLCIKFICQVMTITAKSCYLTGRILYETGTSLINMEMVNIYEDRR